MNNPYITHYNNQAGKGLDDDNQYGRGLPSYHGLRWQKGSGWFGRLFTSGILPFIKQVLPVLGKRALPSGIGLAQDIIAGENVGRSAIKRLKEAGLNLADESVDLLKSKIFSQRGTGGKRHKKFTTRRRKKKATKANEKAKRKRKSNPNYLQ